jgi:hypothetical protein
MNGVQSKEKLACKGTLLNVAHNNKMFNKIGNLTPDHKKLGIDSISLRAGGV